MELAVNLNSSYFNLTLKWFEGPRTWSVVSNSNFSVALCVTVKVPSVSHHHKTFLS